LKILITSILLTIPYTLLANAGSPVIWLSLFHLTIANAIIGYIESEILLKYKIDNKILRVIVANYISMFVGYFLIAPLFLHPKFGRDILSVESGEIFTAFFVSFIATLIIEYPLILRSLKDKSQKKILFKPFLIANIFTNVVMAVIYLLIR
jgi:hypothetical protein